MDGQTSCLNTSSNAMISWAGHAGQAGQGRIDILVGSYSCSRAGQREIPPCGRQPRHPKS